MSDAGAPTISVAIATFNGADRIASALDRVLAQGYDDFELVVVDDGSTDQTSEIVASRCQGDPRVRLVRRDNGGLSAARNTGWQSATGRYIVFLDDDDIPATGWLETFAGSLSDEPMLVRGRYRIVDVEGVVHGEEGPVSEANPWVGAPLAGSFAARRDLLEAIGGFAEDLPISHQTDLVWRMQPVIERAGGHIAVAPKVVIDIVQRPKATRARMDPARRLAGIEYFFEHHEARLAAEPSTYAKFLAIAGVASANLDDYPSARRSFRKALRLHPSDARAWLRLAAATVPMVGRRVWSSP